MWHIRAWWWWRVRKGVCLALKVMMVPVVVLLKVVAPDD